MRKCEWCHQENLRKITSKFCSKDCYKNRWNHFKSTNKDYIDALNLKSKIKHRISKGLDPNMPDKAKKGQGTITPDGYKRLKLHGHPNSSKHNFILEHTLVMSNFLGRPLYKHETVHHKNGIRHDNRIENLELWSRKHGAGQRVSDKIAWCIEFLKEYGIHVNTNL